MRRVAGGLGPLVLGDGVLDGELVQATAPRPSWSSRALSGAHRSAQTRQSGWRGSRRCRSNGKSSFSSTPLRHTRVRTGLLSVTCASVCRRLSRDARATARGAYRCRACTVDASWVAVARSAGTYGAGHRRQLRDRAGTPRWNWPRTAPQVVLACRNAGAGRAGRATGSGPRCPARRSACAAGPGLAGLGGARSAEGWDGPLDLLINNAGVMAPPRLARDRRRLRAAVRHQPPGALRADRPAAAGAAGGARRGRVVTVSSIAHRGGTGGRAARPTRGPGYQPQRGLRELQAGQPAVRAGVAAPGRAAAACADLGGRASRGVGAPACSPSREGMGANPVVRRGRPVFVPGAAPVGGGRRAADAVRGDRGRARLATPARSGCGEMRGPIGPARHAAGSRRTRSWPRRLWDRQRGTHRGALRLAVAPSADRLGSARMSRCRPTPSSSSTTGRSTRS